MPAGGDLGTTARGRTACALLHSCPTAGPTSLPFHPLTRDAVHTVVCELRLHADQAVHGLQAWSETAGPVSRLRGS
jgi:hypothetical protein